MSSYVIAQPNSGRGPPAWSSMTPNMPLTKRIGVSHPIGFLLTMTGALSPQGSFAVRGPGEIRPVSTIPEIFRPRRHVLVWDRRLLGLTEVDEVRGTA